MQEWKGEALVLQLGIFRESDVWLKLLCKGYGLFTVFAFGGMRSIRRFCGCLDTLNTLLCHIRASGRREYLCLEEASLVESPKNLRQDWRQMGIAANCMRFMQALPIDAENSIACYELLQELKKLLCGSSTPDFLLPFLFRLRLAALLGFAPQFERCAVCGHAPRPNPVFDIKAGLIYCDTCAGERVRSQGIRLTARCLLFLNSIINSSPGYWPRANFGWDEQSACKRLIDGFTQYHLGIEPGDHGFVKIRTKAAS